MGWLEELPSGSWRAGYRDPVSGGKRTRTFATKADAKTFLATVVTDIHRGQYVDPRGGALLFRDWVNRWLEVRLVRPATRYTDAGRLRNHLLPHLGALRLRDITPLVVRRWVLELTTVIGGKTVRHCHALLSTVVNDAIVEGLLLTNPCRGTRLPTVEESPAVALTEEQLAALIDATPEHWQPLIITAAGTGLRWGELGGLKRSRVQLLRRRLEVVETLVEAGGRVSVGPPKTPRSRRVVSLPSQVVDALADQLGRHDDEYVFVSTQGGPIRRENFWRRVWRPTLAAAGITPPPRFHDLRHTHVSLLIAAGVPMKAIQERLGHTSIVTTMDRYGHLLPDVDDALLSALEARLPASSRSLRLVSSHVLDS
jgi:integrase